MNYLSRISLGSLVSFVVYPIDEYTGDVVDRQSYNIEFSYDHKSPIQKQDGYIVFRGLPPGKYELCFKSRKYFDKKMFFTIDDGETRPHLICVPLKPRPSYSFDRGATLIRFSVIDDMNIPIRDAAVRAEIITEAASKAKIAKMPLKKGDTDIFLTAVTGKIALGDMFYIGKEENKEDIVIDRYIEGLKCFGISGEILYEHDRGSLLMPLIETCTDERGEAVIYFRSLPIKSVKVKISITHLFKSKTQEIDIEEGREQLLGKIKI